MLLLLLLLSNPVRHTPLSVGPGKYAPVATEAECEGPCCGMRRFLLTNREAPGVGPTDSQREEVWGGSKVNGKGLLQVSLSYSNLKIWCSKERTGSVLQLWREYLTQDIKK